jgi:hypothetical protein
VLESYRLIAPRRTVAKLDGGAAPAAKKGPKRAVKRAAPKTAKTAAKSARGRRS